MPTYIFRNKETQKEHTDFMSISEMEEYLEKNPNVEIVPSAPGIVDPYSVGRVKPPKQFDQLLKKIKKGNSRGFSKCTIQTGNLSEI